MSSLTKSRLEKATPILERHRTKLMNEGDFRVSELESELKTCWGVGYTDLKSIMPEMLKNERFRLVAVRYMEQSNGGTIVVSSGFKGYLAEVYGIKNHDLEGVDAKKKFWDRELRRLHLTMEQKRALRQLGAISDAEVVSQEAFNELCEIGLVEKQSDGSYDFTDDGEDAYYREFGEP
jgi:hypothetical protein